MGLTKITTCCYCGARAALRLEGRVRHELACSNCGAPISQMKMLPKPSLQPATAAVQTRPVSQGRPAHFGDVSRPQKPKKKSKSKGLIKKVWNELWDEIEDIFD